MKSALALVLAGTAIGAVDAPHANASPVAPQVHGIAVDGPAPAQAPLVLADSEGNGWGWFFASDDGSDDDSSGDDDCDPLRDATCAAGNAAPAGTVAPPKNGLFTDGSAPVVKSN